MDALLLRLRAIAEPTRLRLMALAGQGTFCVAELTDILGQSQPRLSRHLRLLTEAGLLIRTPEGSNVWFSLAEGEAGQLARDLLARLPGDDGTLAADRRRAARIVSDRARAASAQFRRRGAEWDEMRALGLDAAAVEAAILALLPRAGLGQALDIGTGTGRLLALLAPRIDAGLGIDASRFMLALARTRLSDPSLSHCRVRQADMYRLPLADRSQDLAVLQMVLHHAEDPEAALAEAARVVRDDGRVLVIDLAPHDDPRAAGLAHRWPGFSEPAMHRLLCAAGIDPAPAVAVPGPSALAVRIWSGTVRAGIAPRPPAVNAFAEELPA